MPLAFYNNILHTNVGNLLVDLVGFLVDDQSSTIISSFNREWRTANGGSGGVGWTLVEVYSASTSAVREIPVTGTGNGTLDSLPTGTNGWRAGSLVPGDWAVLRSLGPDPFELYIEYDNNDPSVILFKLFPMAADSPGDAFMTGGAATSPPTASFPSTSVPVDSGTFVSMTLPGETVLVDYYGNCDEQTFMLLGIGRDDTGEGFVYLGAVGGGNRTVDPYPYVIYNTTATVRFEMTTLPWLRLSPVDHVTQIALDTLNWNNNTSNDGGGNPATLDQSFGTGVHPIFPLGCVSLGSDGHEHFAGWLRNVGGVSREAGAIGTINDPGNLSGPVNYIFRNDGSLASVNAYAITMVWDGETSFP